MEGQIGTLRPGALADVAVMKMVEHPFTFRDSYGNDLPAERMLLPQMTIKAGRTCYRNIEFTSFLR